MLRSFQETLTDPSTNKEPKKEQEQVSVSLVIVLENSWSFAKGTEGKKNNHVKDLLPAPACVYPTLRYRIL